MSSQYPLSTRRAAAGTPPLVVPQEPIGIGATGFLAVAVFFLVTLVVVDVVPDFFIRSYVSKGELNMGLLLLTYVLGAVAFGWYGIFLAPIVLVVFVHFVRDILPILLGSDASTT